MLQAPVQVSQAWLDVEVAAAVGTFTSSAQPDNFLPIGRDVHGVRITQTEEEEQSYKGDVIIL